MSEPRAYTEEEVRAKVIAHVSAVAEYWASLPNQTPRERCDGVAFSLLVMLDGGSMDLPAMDVSLAPHPDDKPFHEACGENWFEPGMMFNDCQLHELFCEARR